MTMDTPHGYITHLNSKLQTAAVKIVMKKSNNTLFDLKFVTRTPSSAFAQYRTTT